MTNNHAVDRFQKRQFARAACDLWQASLTDLWGIGSLNQKELERRYWVFGVVVLAKLQDMQPFAPE
jgi:hypothetical protein